MRLFRGLLQDIPVEKLEGKRLSFTSAVAYYKPEQGVVVCAPVPLNLLVGWWFTWLVPYLLRGYQARWIKEIEITHSYELQWRWSAGFREGLLAQRKAKP